jgi:hypothetical protein
MPFFITIPKQMKILHYIGHSTIYNCEKWKYYFHFVAICNKGQSSNVVRG